MSLIDTVRSDMMAAMKAKDKERKDALSALLSALKNKAIDKKEDLTNEEEIQVVRKEIKQLKETMETTPKDRVEILQECENRLHVLEKYAPALMDEDAIRTYIEETLTEIGIGAPSLKDKGKIMKVLMPKVKGKADGSQVNDILSTYFK